MSPHAHVINATYNQVPLLRLVLRGCLRQTKNDFSLVLADNGSGPDQAAFLRTFWQMPTTQLMLTKAYDWVFQTGCFTPGTQ